MDDNTQPLAKITLEGEDQEIQLNGEPIEDISKIQQTILRFFVQNPLIRHNQYTLMNLVWPDPETHKDSTPNALQAHIFQIRKRIEPDPTRPQYLVTWYGRPGGYQFFPEGKPEASRVEAVTDDEAASGKIWINPETQNLHQGEALLQGLSARQLTLLRHFVEQPFMRHTRETLINLGWSEKEQQKGVNPGALQAHVVQIRKRIEPDFSKPYFLVTWHGKNTTGYQFFPEGKSELSLDDRSENLPAKDEFWYDEVTENLYRGHALIRGLSERQFILLKYLVQNPMIKHTRHTLVSQAWSEEEIEKGVTRNTLQVHIYQIRKKIEPDLDNPRYLLTWDGKPGGYCFVSNGQLQPWLEQVKVKQQVCQGKISFHEESQGIFQGEALIEGLSEKQYNILRFMIANPEVRHPQEVLIEQIYAGKDKQKDASVKALYRYVEQIRKKIEPNPAQPSYLVTWHGRPGGYQFFPHGRSQAGEVTLGEAADTA